MYSYFQAYGLSNQFGSQFVTVDLSNTTIEEIFNNYTQVYLSLNYSYATSQILADFNQLKTTYRYSTQTLNQLLATLPNGFFTILPNLPYFKVHYNRYIDASIAGYTLSENGANIVLTNSAVTTNNFLRYCLTTVNDYIMPTEVIDGQINIQNGMLQSVMQNRTKVGLISFEDIGEILYQDILSTNVIAPTNKTLDELLYIKTNLPVGYVTFLVLNGYLIAPTSEGFYPIGNGVHVLSLRKLGFHFKLLDSRFKQYYDYDYITQLLPSSLTSQYASSNNRISTQLINTPSFIDAYLGLPNTFLFQVPAQNIIIKTKNILNTTLQNMITTVEEPTHMLIGSQGKIVDYFYVHREGKYIITSPNMYINNYINMKNVPNNSAYITKQRLPYDPLVRSSLYFKQYGFYDLGNVTT